MYKEKISEMITNAVQTAYKDLQEVAKEHNIAKIVFSLHNDCDNLDIPCATFNDDDGYVAYEVISEVVFNEDTIVIISENYSGYIDKYYGDYFDVAQSIGRIYESIMTIIDNNDLKDIELN